MTRGRIVRDGITAEFQREVCVCAGERHRSDCPFWTPRVCECDPMGEGLDHHRWCGQHPTWVPALSEADR